jgi:hypothetical protein
MAELPPRYRDLVFQAPHAAGFLWCNGQLCCERGQWTGNPLFLRGQESRTVARRWYLDRIKQMNAEGALFFPPSLEPHPADPGLPEQPSLPRSPGRRARRA